MAQTNPRAWASKSDRARGGCQFDVVMQLAEPPGVSWAQRSGRAQEEQGAMERPTPFTAWSPIAEDPLTPGWLDEDQRSRGSSSLEGGVEIDAREHECQLLACEGSNAVRRDTSRPTVRSENFLPRSAIPRCSMLELKHSVNHGHELRTWGRRFWGAACPERTAWLRRG